MSGILSVHHPPLDVGLGRYHHLIVNVNGGIQRGTEGVARLIPFGVEGIDQAYRQGGAIRMVTVAGAAGREGSASLPKPLGALEAISPLPALLAAGA